MDPNEALNIIRKMGGRAEDARTKDLYITVELPALRELADAVQALDEWITNGGFLPKEWAHVTEVQP